MKKTICIAVLLFIVSLSIAQTVVKGKILDENGQAIVGTNVYVDKSYDGGSADVDGNFEFTTTESGTRILRIESLGYEPQALEVDLSAKLLVKNVVMKEAFNQLEAVEITAGSFEAGDRKRAIELTSMDVATTAGAMGDIVGALNTLPGTTRVGESGRLYVRGGSSEETKTFIDDLLVANPYYSTAPNVATRGRFNPFLFSGTVFNTGGYSAEYGQALSSVLLLNTTNAKVKDELNLSLIAGLGGDMTGTKSWETGSLTASGTYFNLAPYIALVKQSQDWDKPMELFSNEISVKQKTGKSGLLKWYSNVNQSDFSIYQKDLDHPGQKFKYGLKTNHYFVNTSWKYNLNEKWLFFSGVSMTKNVDQIRFNGSPSREESEAMHSKAGLDYQFSEKVNIRFGGEYFYNHYHQTQWVLPGLRKSFNNNLFAAFAEANLYTSTRFVVRAGGRFERSELLNRSSVTPRASAAFKIDDVSQLSLACGTYYQLPLNQDLMYTTKLDFEKAEHVLVNYQRTVLSRLFRAEVFYKNYKDLVKFDEAAPFARTNFSNNGTGYAYGFDMFLRDAKTIRNGHYWISYSWLKTERYYRNYPEKAIPGFAASHSFSVVYKQYWSAARSMIGTDFSYSSPRRYDNPNRDGFNEARMPAYHAMNISWAFLFRNQIIFYAAVNNVLGRQNQFGYRYSSQPADDGKYAREAIVPGAPRFYLLGVFFTFSKDKTRNQLDKIN